mgnify:FL=1
MKRIVTFLIVLQLMCIPMFVGAQSMSSPGEEYTMPKKDGNLGEKEVDGYLTFYDMGGKDGNTVAYYAGKICFVPKNMGEQIEITFDEVDLSGVASVYV